MSGTLGDVSIISTDVVVLTFHNRVSVTSSAGCRGLRLCFLRLEHGDEGPVSYN